MPNGTSPNGALMAAADNQAARVVFSTSRAAEFLDLRALQSQTGQHADNFGDVVVKELLDNALDAAETAQKAPQIETIVETDGSVQRITVTDNGPGLPAEVIERILDFNVLVSDKSAYRSPTRGMQGNAWKTILGIPHALDVTDPVVIEAQGVRHEIAVSTDPCGDVVARHDRTASERTAGTSVTVPLPDHLSVDTAAWVQKFAAVNPHATLAHLANRADSGSAYFYKATVQSGWRKPLPADATSPHWYDEAAMKRLVFAHIRNARAGGRDIPIGEFIRSFAGLSGRNKEKTVKAQLPGIERLTDFADGQDAVTVMLKAMQAEAKAPPLAVLGQVHEDHYRAHLDAAFGVERFWFRRRRLDLDGVPWQLEVALAETARPGTGVYGVNYSATFGDPLTTTWLPSADDQPARGAASFLARADAWPGYANDHCRAVVLHLACPTPEFTDKGKVALTVPNAVAEAFAETLGDVTKVLRREHKRAERDARAALGRRERERKADERRNATDARPRITLKEAVFSVMAEAITEASSGGTLPFPTRNLFYAVRPRIQSLTDAELKMNYFSQDLVVEYEREHGRIHGHYRDPRGELFEPHTRKTVRLGTREVADYVLPSHLFNKILYVEKEGFKPVFEASKLADRYDLAIASGKGQPVEAVRDLFARAEAGPGNYKLFVMHDADHSGYIIARAIAEETARMPGYSVDVIDLGLTAAEAIARGLPTEKYTRRVELPYWMPDRLNDAEHEWFGGRKVARKQWECTRVELNALGAAGLIDLIEQGLRQHGATGKVVPPAQHLRWAARGGVDAYVSVIVEQVLAELIDPKAVARQVAAEFARPKVVGLRQADINRRLRNNSPDSWSAAVAGEVGRRLNDDKIRDRVRHLLVERIADHTD